MGFNRDSFIAEFSGALDLLKAAESAGSKTAKSNFDKLFFIGCGAPFQMMRSLNYWADRYAANTSVRTFHAGEFVHLLPAAMDDKSLIFLGSHSGTTKEVVNAAELLAGKSGRTLASTQHSDSALGRSVDQPLAYGASKQGYFSSLMITLAFLSAYLKERESAWKFHTAVMSSLENLPKALAESREIFRAKGEALAEKLKGRDFMYFIGSGPMYTTAYIFAACFLMEMQWMRAYALTAAEFFHGPFEVFNTETPAVLLLGEDPSRPEVERVLTFMRKHLREPDMYDSRDFPMGGIDPQIRPLLAPFVLDAAMTNMVEALAELNQHPLTTRRYMGKVDY